MSEETPPSRRRRPRYAGKNPRRFEDKYKEHDPEKYPETFARVLAAGKTPAGSHRPIMTREVFEILRPTPGEIFVDCTLGYGGHAGALLPRIQPGGRLIGLDVDPIEQPRTEARLRAAGFGAETFTVRRSNFAGLAKALAAEGLSGADGILADLGVSSMQLDTPARGFSVKIPGPLDMRMNPERGQPASVLLAKIRPEALATLLDENADEPAAEVIGVALAGKNFALTTELAAAIRTARPNTSDEERDKSVRRVFQALRIAVNEELSALDALLRQLPECLNPGGRVVILTFHSGEDRRVKKAFQAAFREGRFSRVADEVLRPSAEECRENPRASATKLRWAVR